VRPPARPDGDPAAGFILLVVLWVLVLLALIAAHLVTSGRAELALARNTRAAAEAASLADAAFVHAAFMLGDPRPAERWPVDGVARRVALPGGEAEIVAEDEGGRVNVNLASRELLAALFAELGAEFALSDEIALSIVGRRGAAVETDEGGRPRERGATSPEGGQAASPSAGPAAGAERQGREFESIDELVSLNGMTPALLAAARPYLTVYTADARPNPMRAAPQVLAALERVGRRPVAAAPAEPPPPPAVLRISVRARSRSGAVASFAAVARLDPRRPKGCAVLWRGKIEETGGRAAGARIDG
jgi:general secretion pathway protein K